MYKHIIHLEIDMEFKFSDFAAAGSGNICINDLTVVFGPNNSGKTYINYAVYSVLESFRNLFDFGLRDSDIKKMISEMKNNSSSKITLNKLNDNLVRLKNDGLRISDSELKSFFQLPLSNFEHTKFHIKLDKLELLHKQSVYGTIMGELIDFRYEFEKGNWTLTFSLNKQNNISKNISSSFNDFNIHLIKSRITDSLINFHFSNIIPNVFAITSERTGISLFYKAYDYMNNEIIESYGQTHNFGVKKIIDMRSFHALPIGDNINILRFHENLSQVESMFTKNTDKYNYVLTILSKLLNEGFFESKNGLLNYATIIKGEKQTHSIPLYAASSSVKSLFLFDLFIKHVAQKNSFLIIDEPELNLSADRQVEIARLIARLVNSGIKVVVTTHSDYFVREINNLIALSGIPNKTNKKKLMKEFNIHDKDLLVKSKVSAYKTNIGGDIEEVNILDSGIDSKYWDDIIVPDNYRSHKIYKESIGL